MGGVSLLLCPQGPQTSAWVGSPHHPALHSYQTLQHGVGSPHHLAWLQTVQKSRWRCMIFLELL